MNSKKTVEPQTKLDINLFLKSISLEVHKAC